MCSQIQLKVYLPYHNTKCFEARGELRRESPPPAKKIEGEKKDEVKNSLSFEAIKWE